MRTWTHDTIAHTGKVDIYVEGVWAGAASELSFAQFIVSACNEKEQREESHRQAASDPVIQEYKRDAEPRAAAWTDNAMTHLKLVLDKPSAQD